jgi:hypothetical protein
MLWRCGRRSPCRRSLRLGSQVATLSVLHQPVIDKLFSTTDPIVLLCIDNDDGREQGTHGNLCARDRPLIGISSIVCCVWCTFLYEFSSSWASVDLLYSMRRHRQKIRHHYLPRLGQGGCEEMVPYQLSPGLRHLHWEQESGTQNLVDEVLTLSDADA